MACSRKISSEGSEVMGKKTYNRTRKLKQLVKDMLLMMSLDARSLCFFCGESLLEADVLKITVHHINGNHEDDRPENLALSHECCHRGYHAKVILHGENNQN